MVARRCAQAGANAQLKRFMFEKPRLNEIFVIGACRPSRDRQELADLRWITVPTTPPPNPPLKQTSGLWRHRPQFARSPEGAGGATPWPVCWSRSPPRC